jgi:hypothetical protein
MEHTLSTKPINSSFVTVESIDSVGKYFAALEKAMIVAKRKHWMATRNSYAKHLALEDLYKQLNKKVDLFIESYQGCYEVLVLPSISIRNDIDIIELLKSISKEDNINLFKESFLKNQFDEISTIIYQFIYKWKNLG